MNALRFNQQRCGNSDKGCMLVCIILENILRLIEISLDLTYFKFNFYY